MSSFWSWYITIIALANIFGCWWLIRWTAKPRPGEAAEHETTGHVWDDNLMEYNKPMPRWWLWLFYITIVFGLIYLALFPGLGRYPGLLGWSQEGAWAKEVAAVEERVGPLFAAYAARDIAELANDSEAMQTGRRLFGNNCAVCHGADGGGATGFPALNDGHWVWGGSPEAIKHSILQGRVGVMPARGGLPPEMFSESEVADVAAYVRKLAGQSGVDGEMARRGQEKYGTICFACHGADGTGNAEQGWPDLTTNKWIYGGSQEAIEETIRNGRHSEMPAHKELLGEDRVHVLAAYVYSLSR